MIRKCTRRDFERILLIINEAAQSYKGVIPKDCWHEPYMPADELRREMGEMTFFGEERDGEVVGVMGYQPLEAGLPVRVTLIRHAYVLPSHQGRGIGGLLLGHLLSMSRQRRTGAAPTLLVGTWAANAGAIRFYERHGFRLLPDEEGQELLRRHWKIPGRQRETSIVLEWRN